MGYLKIKIRFIIAIFSFFVCIQSQELDKDITLEKKSLIILPSDLNSNNEVADQILSIISSQATSVGKFEIIDRNFINEILEEQKFQLSGMVNDKNIVEIGNLASADEALILNVIHFNQKGVPKEKEDVEDDEDDKDNTLFSWLVKTVVTEAIEQAKKPDSTQLRLELENNIHTEFRGSVKIVNLESGKSEKSFELNASHTGGNKAQSLSQVLNQITIQTRTKLKRLYMITSEIIQVNGAYVSILSGKNLGLKKGAMFEVSSKNRTKTYKGRTISLPGKTRGLLRITEVGPDASQARIVRKWRPIRTGHRAYELKYPAEVFDIQFTYLENTKYQLSGKFWISPSSRFSGSFQLLLGSIQDSREKMNNFIGFGSDLRYTIFSGFGITGSTSLTIPVLFPFRRDDANHFVSSIFSDPSINGNLAIQINSKMDIVFSMNHIYTTLHGPWQWRRDTGEKNDEGKKITETEPAVWTAAEPVLHNNGTYFSVSIRFLRF